MRAIPRALLAFTLGACAAPEVGTSGAGGDDDKPAPARAESKPAAGPTTAATPGTVSPANPVTGAGGQSGAVAAPDGGADSPDAGGATTDAGLPPVAVAADKWGTLPQGGGIKGSGMAFEDRLHSYDLRVADADWKSLNENALKEQFVPAQLIVNGQDVGKVGLRYKGSQGSFRVCLKTGNPEKDASPECPKFSFKIGFDEYEPGKRYYGLKKVNLHSMIRDPSKLHERLAYQLFRDMGIATARSTHAKVTINGVYKGLFALTEHMSDGRFTADKWPSDPNGNLYKEAWPIWLFPAYYSTKIETNADMMPSHDKIMAFAAELKRATDGPQAFAMLAKWTDADWLARYLAVDTAIKNGDGITTFYCVVAANPNDCQNHNFFWYQTKDNRFLLLPWDLDYTFVVPSTFDVVPLWDKPVASCAERSVVWGVTKVLPPSCDPLLKAFGVMRPMYVKAVKDLLAGPFVVKTMQASLDRWAAQIDPAVMLDKTINHAAWKIEVAKFKGVLETLRQRMQVVADGK